MPAITAIRHPHSAEHRRIRLAERDREAREREWQRRLQIIPFL